MFKIPLLLYIYIVYIYSLFHLFYLHISKILCNFAAQNWFNMRKIVLFFVLLASLSVGAQVKAILGDWKTVDDKTGEKRSIVTIYKGTDGLYYGKISKMLMGEPGLKCTECVDADHNAPLEGLIIIRGMSFNAEKNQLENGRVLDPESGKFYYGKIYPKDGNLVLRGSLDKRGFLGRNQTWIR